MSPTEHIKKHHDSLTAIRRNIHALPELGFEEDRTSDMVAEKLAGWGIDIHRGLGKTGGERTRPQAASRSFRQ